MQNSLACKPQNFTDLHYINLVIDLLFNDSKINLCRSRSNRMTRVVIVANFVCNVDNIFSKTAQSV